MRRVWNSAERSHRTGKGLLPPNPNQWNNEHAALDVREELALPLDVPLSHTAVYSLLPDVYVCALCDLPAAPHFLAHFRGAASGRWSGLAVRVAPDLSVVVYNDSHPLTRIRATLMEEFFHVWLDHPKDSLRVYGPAEANRTFDRAKENEAYSCGAAALVPYAGLRSKVQLGWTISRIARHFEVSPDLVVFRAKVTRTYKALRRV